MKKALLAGTAMLACAGSAFAGGVERSTQSVAILFEDGQYADFTIGHVDPNVSGTQLLDASGFGSPPGSKSGDVIPGHTTVGLGFKTDINDKVALAFVIDEPIGADVAYGPDAPVTYLYGTTAFGYQGSTASLESTGYTAMLKYAVNDRVSVYGGARMVETRGVVNLFNGYSLDAPTESDLGFLVGAAYEIPDIALRVALTYNSEITHNFSATEASPLDSVPPTNTFFDMAIPQSLNLEFQSGVAADTLVFGSIRWVDWTAFEIAPTIYTAGGTRPSLVSFQDDTITYNLGIGRRFSESWSAAVTASHEPATGGFRGNLGPADGSTSLGLAATYTTGNWEITGGARYIWIGDATTEAPVTLTGGARGVPFADFKNNDGWAVGIRVAYNY